MSPQRIIFSRNSALFACLSIATRRVWHIASDRLCGPGGWATYALWIAGSSYRIAAEDYSEIDPNTWGFLMATTFAAIDLLRQTQEFRTLDRQAQSTDSLMERYAAATNLGWIGLWNGRLQAYFCLSNRIFLSRVWTLLVGLFIPANAQIWSFMTILLSAHSPVRRIPTVCWEGMNPGLHTALFYFFNSLGFQLIFLGSFATFSHLHARNHRSVPDYRRIETIVCGLALPCGILFFVALLWGSLLRGFIWLDNWFSVSTADMLISFPLLPLVVMFTTFFFPYLFVPAHIAISTFVFIPRFIDVLALGDPVRKSCFFIPCAPQSLLEMDQAAQLLIGVTILVGADIAPPILRDWRKKRLVLEEVNQRVGARVGARVNSGFEMTSTATADSTPESLNRRTNSGIVRQLD